MASEAQRLIGISLSKIAQSRSHRGGVSLHKNLLVATVLQKARYIFMEEAYNMVHYQSPVPVSRPMVSSTAVGGVDQRTSGVIPQPEDDLVALTAEEAGMERTVLPEDVVQVQEHQESTPVSTPTPEFSCMKCAENQDKENHPPYHASELTYLDLDKSSNVLRERSNSLSLKRRRAIAEWETEEAVQSILPKRSRPDDVAEGGDDSVFLDDATLLSDAVSKELEEIGTGAATGTTSTTEEKDLSGSSMEIDRITSLVSIFSFSMGDGKLNRSMSAPDLCSAQAKDAQESIQQRQFLAMTV